MNFKYFLLSLLFANQVFAQEFKERTLETSIEEVTVFLKGAQIARTGKVEIQPGKSVVVVKSLSPHLDEKSIQVKATGDFTILSVNHGFNYLSGLKKDEKADSLRRAIELLEEKVSRNHGKLEVLSEKHSLLDANKDLSGDNSNISLVQLQQALDFYERQISLIKSQEFKLKKSNKELHKMKGKLERQISDVLFQEDQPTSEIRIRVESKKKVTGKFNMTYLVQNAGWYPNYDVRVESIEKPINLNYKADVYQNTGVDWNNVKLRFSNGDPNQSGVAPELSTWYLNYARNTVYSRSSGLDKSIRSVSGKIVSADDGKPLMGVNVVVEGSTIGTVSDLQGNYSITLPNNAQTLLFSFIGMVPQEVRVNNSRIDIAMQSDLMVLDEVLVMGFGESEIAPDFSMRRNSSIRQEPKAKRIVTSTVENQTTVEFEVAIPYTVKSNAEKLSIDLNAYNIETVYEYYAVPKLDKDAFLIARIINWDQYNLLEGEANLYFEDAYVGRSVLDARALEDTLDISLGRDKNIVIGRVKNDEFTKKRTIGSNKVETRGFEIIARNKKSQTIKLTLFDQLPVAAISDISVIPTELSGAKLDEKTGQVVWELLLPAQEQKELELKYEVKYPKRERLTLE